MELLSFPALSVKESGLTPWSSPHLGGGLKLNKLCASPVVEDEGVHWLSWYPLNRGHRVPPHSILLWMGVGRSNVLSPAPYLWLSSMIAVQPLGTGETQGTI